MATLDGAAWRLSNGVMSHLYPQVVLEPGTDMFGDVKGKNEKPSPKNGAGYQAGYEPKEKSKL